MNINATCIVQIINFWITYVMLHKLLFTPFVQRLNRKKLLFDKLVNGLQDRQQLLLKLQHDKKSSLDAFRDYLKKHYAAHPAKLERIPPMIAFVQDKSQLSALIEAEKNLIIQKVSSCLIK